jgi:hypothetical protein
MSIVFSYIMRNTWIYKIVVVIGSTHGTGQAILSRDAIIINISPSRDHMGQANT